MIFGKKEDKRKKEEKIRNYLAKTSHYLEVLEKRISIYHEKLEKISRLIDLAAEREEKALLVRALRAKRQIKKKLKFYMGQQQDLRAIIGKIQQSRRIKDYERFMREGKEIMEITKVSPEDIEREKAEAEVAMEEMETTRKIVSEPIGGQETGYDQIEEEAEELIAEKSLPELEKSSEEQPEEEKKEKTDLKDLKKEMDDIL